MDKPISKFTVFSSLELDPLLSISICCSRAAFKILCDKPESTNYIKQLVVIQLQYVLYN